MDRTFMVEAALIGARVSQPAVALAAATCYRVARGRTKWAWVVTAKPVGPISTNVVLPAKSIPC